MSTLNGSCPRVRSCRHRLPSSSCRSQKSSDQNEQRPVQDSSIQQFVYLKLLQRGTRFFSKSSVFSCNRYAIGFGSASARAWVMKTKTILIMVLWTLEASAQIRTSEQGVLPDQLTIDRAVAEAVENNIGLLAERYNVTIAQARLITARLRPNPVLSSRPTSWTSLSLTSRIPLGDRRNILFAQIL